MKMGSKLTHSPRDGTPTDTVEDHDTEDESNTHPCRALVCWPVIGIGSYKSRRCQPKKYLWVTSGMPAKMIEDKRIPIYWKRRKQDCSEIADVIACGVPAGRPLDQVTEKAAG